MRMTRWTNSVSFSSIILSFSGRIQRQTCTSIYWLFYQVVSILNAWLLTSWNDNTCIVFQTIHKSYLNSIQTEKNNEGVHFDTISLAFSPSYFVVEKQFYIFLYLFCFSFQWIGLCTNPIHLTYLNNIKYKMHLKLFFFAKFNTKKYWWRQCFLIFLKPFSPHFPN